MQPYFFPYIGYFQLIENCDLFVLHDDVKYTKKGWITRNRLQDSGVIRGFSLSLKRDSDYSQIRERVLSPDFDKERLVRVVANAYAKSPYFEHLLPLVKKSILQDATNLVDYLHASIENLCNFLQIRTPIIRSSSLRINADLRGQSRVIAICQQLGATEYINPIGGLDLYDSSVFASNDLELLFLRANLTPYAQSSTEFVEALSIIDCIAYKGPEGTTHDIRTDFTLIQDRSI